MQPIKTVVVLTALCLMAASCGETPRDATTDVPSIGTSTQALCPANCECNENDQIVGCIEPTDLTEKFGQILAEIIMQLFPEDPPAPQSGVTYMSVGCNFQKTFSGQDYQGTAAYSTTVQYFDEFNAPASGQTQNTNFMGWECNLSACYPLGVYNSGDDVGCNTTQNSHCQTYGTNTYGSSATNGPCRRYMGVLLNGPNASVYGQACVNVRDSGEPVCPTDYYSCQGSYTQQVAATLTPAGAEQKCLDEKISGPYGFDQVSPTSCSCNCTTPDTTTHEFSCTCTGEFVFEYNGPTPNDESTQACTIDTQCGTDTNETCSCAASSDGQNYYMCS